MKRLYLLLFCLCFPAAVYAQAQCGLDMFIINDQSGSVNSTENTQSREFITELATQSQPLGTASDESRISISEFANSNTYQRYDFPGAGAQYTIDLGDVLAYQYETRTLQRRKSMALHSIKVQMPSSATKPGAERTFLLRLAAYDVIPQSIDGFVSKLSSDGTSLLW